MKKLTTLLMAAAMAVTMTACSAKTDGGQNAGEQKQEESADKNTEAEKAPTAKKMADEKMTIESKKSPTLLQAQLPKKGDEIAVVKTNMGEIRLMFFPEQAPKAVENFKTLAKDGYYNNLLFHRVINEFMIQGGDPLGTGTGGESMWKAPFEDEISPDLHFFRGALAMANSGPNTNGSQFFMVQTSEVDKNGISAIEEAKKGDEKFDVKIGDASIDIKDIFTDEVINHYNEKGGAISLEYAFGAPYTIFGQIYQGFDTLDAIANVETDVSDKPTKDVIIESITFENIKD